MKRLIWLPLAGFLLIAGAAVAAAAPTVVESAKGLFTAVDSSQAAHPITGEARVRVGGGLLEEVLADLVTAGTITQAQSDAITDALEAKADEKVAEMEARRLLIRSFVEDGVITQDEINQLPADDPLRAAFNSIANDGQITLDQLRDLGPFGGRGGHGGPGHHAPGGFFMWGPDVAPDADDSTDSDAGTSNS